MTTTISTPDIESLKLALDLDHTNQTLRSILADAYEDVGDKESIRICTILRWLVEHNKCPDKDFCSYEKTWAWFNKDWEDEHAPYKNDATRGKIDISWQYIGGARDRIPQSLLPRKFFDTLKGASSSNSAFHPYHTREEAELALFYTLALPQDLPQDQE